MICASRSAQVRNNSMSFPVAVYPSSVADADLERRALAYLASRNYRSFRRLRVEAVGGVVTLTGQLSTYHEKQVAQESVRRVAGVVQVIDAIQVAAGSVGTDSIGPGRIGTRRSGTGRIVPPPEFVAQARRIELPQEVEIALACS
jgi:osmotically-inducible protein OsmY